MDSLTAAPSAATPFRVSKRQPSLRRALLLLASVATGITAAEIPMVSAAYPDQAVLVSAYAVVGFTSVVVGTMAWDRRPSNGTGALLCVSGFLTLASSAFNVGDPTVSAVGHALSQAPIAALLHLLLAFPSGRLRGNRDRALVLAGYFITVGLQVPRQLAPQIGWAHLDHRLQVAQNLLGFVVLGLASAVLYVRLRDASQRPGQRSTLGAVYGYGMVILLFFPLTAFLLRHVHPVSPLTLFAVQLVAFFAMPFVLAAGVLRGPFARTGEIDELGTWLGTVDGGRPSLREALAATLGDRSLQLLFQRPGRDEMMDVSGSPAALPDVRSGRAAVEIGGPHGTAGVIVYDRTLIADEELVASAGRVVALALDRERLIAELIAGQEAVRESRARIVEFADRQRRSFAQDMHDLLQSRLLLAALHAGELAADGTAGAAERDRAERLRGELDGAISELRALAHGMMPPLLVERGFFAAARDLVRRMHLVTSAQWDEGERPVDPTVASNGYFILAEALANAVKHARAGTVSVRVQMVGDRLEIEVADDGVGGAHLTGNGLRGMADRVDALGGRMQLVSEPAQGTRIRVDLPCVC